MIPITELEVRSDKLHIRFKDFGEIIFPEWHHQFASKSLGTNKNPLLAKEKTKTLEGKIIENGLGHHTRKVKENYHYTVHVYMQVHEKKKLPSHYRGRKKIDEFVMGHYTEQAQRALRSPGTMANLPDELISIFDQKKYIEKEIDSLREKVGEGLHKATATRRFNQLIREEKGSFVEEKRTIETLISHLGKTVQKETNSIVSLVNNEFSLHLEHSQKPYLQSILQAARNPPVDYLLNAKWLFFDIEIPNFRNEKAEISWVGASFMENGERKNEIHTLHNIGSEFQGYKVFTYESESDLIRGFAERVNEENPLIVSAYNAKFDLIKMRDGEFEIGAKKSKPIYRSTATFFERIGILDRFVIDFMHADLGIGRSYEINQKLETAAGFEKSISYDEMEELENNNGHKKIANYLIGDIDELVNLHSGFEMPLRYGLQISDNYNVSWEKILHSPNTINIDKERLYFSKNGMYRQNVFPFCTKNRKNKENEGMQYFAKTFNTIKGKKGIYKNVVKAHIPIGYWLKPFVKNKNDLKIYEMREKANNPKEKFFFDQFLKSANRWLLQDYGYLKKQIHDFKENIKSNDFKEFKKNFSKVYIAMAKDHDFTKERLVTRMKNADIDEIRKYMDQPVRLSLGEKEITDETFHLLIKKYFATELQKKIIWVNYNVQATRFLTKSVHHKSILTDYLSDKIEETKKWLERKNIPIYGSEGEYLYLPRDRSLLLSSCPVNVVDYLNAICVSDKVHYKKHGFYNHLQIKDHASDRLNMLQMNTYSQMMNALLDDNENLARKLLDDGAKECRTCDVKNLLHYLRSRDEYKIHTKKGLIQFCEEVPEDINEKEIIREEKIPYFKRGRRNIYIGTINDIIDSFTLDRVEAEAIFRKKGMSMLNLKESDEQLELF